MTAAALSALLAALVALTSGRVEYRILTPRFDNTHPQLVAAKAWRECELGKPLITIRGDAGLWEHVWERAGALDCLDDGVMNGSTVPNCDLTWFRRTFPALAVVDPQWEPSECASAYITTGGSSDVVYPARRW